MANSLSKGLLEKRIEQAVIRLCPEALVLKTHQRDWPDRVFFLPGGHCFFIEFKRPGEQLRPGQRAAKERLEEQGFVVYVVDDIAEGIRAIEIERSVEKCQR